jgi:hypothetical protein
MNKQVATVTLHVAAQWQLVLTGGRRNAATVRCSKSVRRFMNSQQSDIAAVHCVPTGVPWQNHAVIRHSSTKCQMYDIRKKSKNFTLPNLPGRQDIYFIYI